MNCIAIDDEPLDLGIISEFCKKINAVDIIGSFTNPVDAIKLLNNEQIDLIFLDIHMPQMDGVEVLRLIKSDPKLKEMPVIILTTTDDPREIEECYQIGCNIYITKPVDFVKFAETLNHLGLFLQIIKV